MRWGANCGAGATYVEETGCGGANLMEIPRACSTNPGQATDYNVSFIVQRIKRSIVLIK